VALAARWRAPVNATHWEPLPGMVKKWCLHCRYLFAVSLEEAEVADAEAIQQLEGLIAANTLHRRPFVSGLDSPGTLRRMAY
jgi:hypothetical protein